MWTGLGGGGIGGGSSGALSVCLPPVGVEPGHTVQDPTYKLEVRPFVDLRHKGDMSAWATRARNGELTAGASLACVLSGMPTVEGRDGAGAGPRGAGVCGVVRVCRVSAAAARVYASAASTLGYVTILAAAEACAGA